MPDNDQPITLIDLPDEILLHLAALPDHPESWDSVARLARTHPVFRNLFHASSATWGRLYQQYFAHHHEMAYQKRGVYPSYKDLMKAREDHFFRREEENSDAPSEPINYRTDSKKFSILSKWFSAAYLGDEKLFFEQMEALEQLEGVDLDRYQDQNGQTIWQFLYAGMPDVQWPERTGKANILKRIFEKLSPWVGKNEEKRIEMQLRCGQITRSDWDAFVKNREELITRANRSVVDLSEKKKADDKLNYFFTLAVKLGYASLARYFMASRNEEKLTDWSPLEVKLTPDGDSIFFEAVKYGRLSVIETLLELASAEERKYLLEQKNNQGNTAFLFAAAYGKADVIEKLWELTSEEEHQRLLEQKNNFSSTAFLCAASCKKVGAIEMLWKLTSEEEHQRLLEQKDKQGDTAFILAAKNGKADVIEKLWKLTSEEDHERLLGQRNYLRYTAFLCAARNGNAGVIAKLLELVFAEERQCLLEQRYLGGGDTAFLYAADQG
ncbi:MAG: ankyrin repeat domain-containing protein [Gammaproteobacteria bacterium]|nr:ankyrin repeat domain-containing protein [Gammaproteobacteria bacterium]